MIETARHHREFIQDPVLKQRVTSLIGQEAIHSKLHNEYNDALKDVEYTVDLYRFWVKTSLNMCFEIPATA